MNKNWSNTLLVAYSSLPKIVKDIDFAFISRVKSGFQSKHLRFGISNDKLFGEMIKLNGEKRKIIELRLLINDALSKLDHLDYEVLTLKLVYHKTYEEIAKSINISIRTVFRRLESAEKNFEQILNNLGYMDENIKEIFENDEYLSPIRNRMLDDKYLIAKNL